ncbi:vegetative cell wall protein gp1-like [Carica papaya]|uniref:vegetative cell wall protein gp1-like n=1 Tax=Carica papaya TaxID=3649 RepID=UPI000B8CA4BB|nr:vegetative cell wall protein gp1-like [Carica papaya]
MSWILIVFILSLSISFLSEARNERKLPSAVVVGTVYCDTCFHEDFSRSSHFISGASVEVECEDGTSRPSFRQEVKTDERGEFQVRLPFSVSKHVKKIKGCRVKLLKSSEPYCAVASTATSSSLHLKSRKQGIHIFSAGFFTFKPQNQPNVCNQKPSIQNSHEPISHKTGIPSTDIPPFPYPVQEPLQPDLPPQDPYHLPPLPLLPRLPPLPQLPPLPPLPGLPGFPPLTDKTKQTKPVRTSQVSDQKVAKPDFFFPPNPLFPPPSIFPPNPFQPPSVLPPNPFQPPPAPIIPLPPITIPGLTPSPPPPVFPFPFPPITFPPSPGFPGIPPASSLPKTQSP